MSKLTTRVLGPDEYPRWTSFVAASPDGSVYSNPGYLEILADCTGGSFEIVVAEKGNEIQGGMALFKETEHGMTMVSPRLMLYYSGIVLKHHATKYPSERTSRQLQAMSALEEAARRYSCDCIRLKSRSTVTDIRLFLERGWTARPSYSYVVPLGDSQITLGRIEQNLRRLIGRAKERGLATTIDDDFEGFYRLHHQVHERKGARLYLLKPAFERLVRRVRAANLGELFHARLPSGESVAAALVLADGHPIAHLVSAGSDGAHQDSGANPYLRWQIFEHLAAKGYRGCDLTDATLGEVTRFKSQLGGDLTMAFTLTGPSSARYRRWEWGRRIHRRLGGVARSLLGRGRPG